MQPECNSDLHGNAPDTCRIALLIVDMINDFEFPGGDRLFEAALPCAHAIARLKERAGDAGVPVVYVNDNFGQWRSDFREQVRHCTDDGVRGQPIATHLAPGADDYFVLKAKHSGFFATPLELLLKHLGARTLVIAGVAGDSCVEFTANDAYLRDFELIVPADTVASIDASANRAAIERMGKNLDATVTLSERIDFARLAQRTTGKNGD